MLLLLIAACSRDPSTEEIAKATADELERREAVKQEEAATAAKPKEDAAKARARVKSRILGKPDAGKLLRAQPTYSLYCSSCHGEDGHGSAEGPSIIAAAQRMTEPELLAWTTESGHKNGVANAMAPPEQFRAEVAAFVKAVLTE